MAGRSSRRLEEVSMSFLATKPQPNRSSTGRRGSTSLHAGRASSRSSSRVRMSSAAAPQPPSQSGGASAQQPQQHGRPSVVLGLTGSVGMGKSTVAKMFVQLGVPLLDADEVVHQLYAQGGEGVEAVRQLFPSAVRDGAVDRAALGRCVLGDKEALARLEHAVHPLVAARRRHFLQAHAGAPLVALDIPLLYEKDLQGEVDCVAVVSTSPELQRERVLARGWTPDKLNAVLALQVPDSRKRELADYIIDTTPSLDVTAQSVAALVAELLQRATR